MRALEIINRFAPPYLRFRINKILEHTGKSLGEALINIRMDFPDPEVINELAMASEQGQLNEALPEVVDSLNDDGILWIKAQANQLALITRMITFIILIGLIMGLFSFIKDMQAATTMF